MHFQNGCYLEFHYFLALGHKFLNIYDSKIEEFPKNSSQSLLQTWIKTFNIEDLYEKAKTCIDNSFCSTFALTSYFILNETFQICLHSTLMHPILCRQALIFRWRIMCRPFFSRCLLLLCPCYDHCSDANQMRNGTPKLGVSLPKAELYLISKLPNTNVNSNSHRPDIHISIHWGQTANIMKRVLTKQETFRLLTSCKENAVDGCQLEIIQSDWWEQNCDWFQQTNSDSISRAGKQMSSELSLV